MASLRNIMNSVDDESQPRSSSSRPVPHSSPLPSSSYPASSDPSLHNHTSPSDYSRGASPHSTYSHTSESSGPRHLQQHLSPPPGRRENGSNEPLGYSYSHSQPYGAGHDMRPIIPGGAMNEPGVKLTPITGRVSRAKKGVPVHTCEMCRPPKTFTRAEHLRRHQLSHQPPDLACSVTGCNKVFHRKDLLERHQQRHEQDERLASEEQQLHGASPRRQGQNFGSSPSRAMQMGSYGASNSPHSSISSTPRHEASGHSNWSSTSRPFGHTLPPPRIPASAQPYYAQSPQSRYSAGSTPGSQGASSPSDSTTHEINAEKRIDHKTPEAGHDFYMSDGDQSISTGRPSSATGSTHSSPSDSSNDRIKRTRSPSTGWSSAGTHLSVSPDLQFNAGRVSSVSYDLDFTASSTGVSLPKRRTGSAFLISSYEDDDESTMTAKSLLASAAIRTLPMSFGAGGSTGVLIAAPPTVFQDRMISPQLSASPPDMEFVDHFATTQSMAILALSQSAREAVPIYIEVYWNKVHPMYPIIHRPTFDKALETTSEAIDALQYTMAAVATQFLGHEDHRINGSQLHFHAACQLKLASDADRWPVETMQAVLLSEYYMRFRGRDKNAFETSDLFEQLYKKAYHYDTQLSDTTSYDRPDKWEEWVEDEAKRRILASCFLLDIHGMRYFERAPVSIPGLDYSSPDTLAIPLSVTKKLWEASTSESWSRLKSNCPRFSVGVAISQGLTPLDMQETSPFDASVLLAAYSLQLPSRQNPTRVDLIQDISGVDLSQINVLSMFSDSAVANAYLALHFTPLHVVLSVSGDSWVFNKKVLRLQSFTTQQSQLSRWRDSGSSAAAAAFAARALVAFLGIGCDDKGTVKVSTSSCGEISDYWGIYVCALICWAFGHVGRDGSGAWNDGSSRPSALQWLQSAAKMQPAQVQRLAGRRNAQAVVGLAREALEHEHFGGRSILIADAVGVLRKLEDGDGCKRF